MSKLIQWPRAKYWDRAWNPVIGCKPVSPACENCYAKAWARRFGQSFEPHSAKRQNPPSRGVVFCGNMTDLWGEWARGTEFYIGEVLSVVMSEQIKPTFLWLTKRTIRLMEMLNAMPLHMIGKDGFATQYFGITAENQECFQKRIVPVNYLKTVFKTWISCEPLLGPIDLSTALLANPKPRWVVVGCESGPHRRRCDLEWVEGIVHQCVYAGIPVFVKQLDIGGKCVTDINRFPEHLRIRQVPWDRTGGER